jgi:hypothetical protein
MTDGVTLMVELITAYPICVDEIVKVGSVVVVVKCLKVLATCRKIWYTVSLLPDWPGKWTYPTTRL